MKVWYASISIVTVIVVAAACGVHQLSQSSDEDSNVNHRSSSDSKPTASASKPTGRILAQPAKTSDPGSIVKHAEGSRRQEMAQMSAEPTVVDLSHATKSSYGLGLAGRTALGLTGSVHQQRFYPQQDYNLDENYQAYGLNPIKRAAEDPLSTFSIDVDSGAYSNMRRFLNLGQMPPADAVRVEELINYFSYSYPVPESAESPFSINTEIAPSPWNSRKHLLQIGLQGYEVARESMPSANLVFLIDVSGSMRSANKLALVKSSLKLLTKQLSSKDSIAIVTYAGSAGTVLEPVTGAEKAKIYEALDRLNAQGSTWGEGGITQAYKLARAAYIENGINRVVLATDGDFNVGVANIEELKKRIKQERKSGIGLTTLGFGMGNYNDAMLEQLADVGNGNYAYIDNLNEARKVLVEEASSTLNTIASDVKIQIEFNPDVVSEYRLIGYENRLLKREDFNNDKVDAGEIGAGHSVTALYEITLKGSGGETIDPLRYKKEMTPGGKPSESEIAFLKLRYKNPGETVSRLVTKKVLREDINPNIESSSIDFKYAAAVSGFGQLLQGSEYLTDWNYTKVIALAKEGRGTDQNGYRAEFVKLVELADALVPPVAGIVE